MDIADLPDEPEHLRIVKKALDEFHRPIKALEQLQRPLRQWEEIQRQLAPIRQWEEIQRQIAPLRQWEEIQRQLDQHRQWDDLQRNLAPLRQWEEMRKLADLHAQQMMLQHLPGLQGGLYQDSLRDASRAKEISSAATLLDPAIERINQHREWFDRLQRHATGGLLVSELAQHVERANPALTSLTEVQRLLDRLGASFHGQDHSEFELLEEDAQAAEEEAERIAEVATTEPTLNSTFVQIAAHIEAQPNESVKLILWAYFQKLVGYIVNAVISAAITVVVTQHMGAAPVQSPQQAVKTVKEAARMAVGSTEMLNEHRFISAKVVSIRLNPKARSPKLAELGFGAVVKVLRKDRDFALIVWKDTDSGAEIQGWVFARYLKKFN
jgi:PAS domain-containing protein